MSAKLVFFDSERTEQYIGKTEYNENHDYHSWINVHFYTVLISE